MRRKSLVAAAAAVLAALSLAAAATADDTVVNKKGVDLELLSAGGEAAATASAGPLALANESTPAAGVQSVSQVQLRGANTQVNDPALDHIDVFPGFRPFLDVTNSETSVVSRGNNIVAGYNSSAGFQEAFANPFVVLTQILLSGYSTSSDGGQTWKSGFLPPATGGTQTFGDPSLGIDRHGNVYYASIGENGASDGIIVNKSTDGGNTWAPASFVLPDNGADKEWLAVGPDPSTKNRDNVYVSWTSFGSGNAGGQRLMFGRSTDGGQTWTAGPIFTPAPDGNPNNPQNALQFSNVTVDQVTGDVYVPFARFSNGDVDFIQVLVSHDGGQTFSFLNFNIPSAPAPDLLPLVQAGDLIDCGSSGGFRLSIHQGANLGGRFGLGQYTQATRLTTQPAFAARNGVLYLAWSQSTSPFFGDPTAGSNIMFIRSSNGGQTWTTPLQVNPALANDTQHVLPSLAIDNDPNGVHVSYYTQHANGTFDLDMANSHDRGATWPVNRTLRITSVSENLPPSNVRLTGGPTPTTNYDRLIRPCYALGEYQSVFSANGTQYLAWGDTRNVVTEPVNSLDPLSGVTHAQTDVFFQTAKAQ